MNKYTDCAEIWYYTEIISVIIVKKFKVVMVITFKLVYHVQVNGTCYQWFIKFTYNPAVVMFSSVCYWELSDNTSSITPRRKVHESPRVSWRNHFREHLVRHRGCPLGFRCDHVWSRTCPYLTIDECIILQNFPAFLRLCLYKLLRVDFIFIVFRQWQKS